MTQCAETERLASSSTANIAQVHHLVGRGGACRRSRRGSRVYTLMWLWITGGSWQQQPWAAGVSLVKQGTVLILQRDVYTLMHAAGGCL